MNSNILNRSGWFLILAGLVGAGISARGMRDVYVSQGGQASVGLAEEISGSLLPAGIGALVLLAGLIMVTAAWWRGRKAKRSRRFIRT